MLQDSQLRNRERYLSALEENKYPQCFGMLLDGNGRYCALGVADPVFELGGFTGCIMDCYNEDFWRDICGFPKGFSEFVQELNDTSRLSFPEIAKEVRSFLAATE